MDRITTTIKREWLREIVAGRKTVEYREIKPYWTERLSAVTTPFALRLINGMQAKAPEVTVVVKRVRKKHQIRVVRAALGYCAVRAKVGSETRAAPVTSGCCL